MYSLKSTTSMNCYVIMTGSTQTRMTKFQLEEESLDISLKGVVISQWTLGC